METLQYVLLPHLSAVNLFRLSCTSRAMQHRLLSTPPHLWLVPIHTLACAPLFGDCLTTSQAQIYTGALLYACWDMRSLQSELILLLVQTNPPQDASPGYLASLPTTDAVLAALRKAHKARLGIMGGLPPAQHELRAPIAVDDMASAHGLNSVQCHTMTFSSCARYLAIVFTSYTHGQNIASNIDSTHYGVLVFDACQGYRQTAIRCAGRSFPALQWAPNSPHLSVAQQVADMSSFEEDISRAHPAVEILDVQTGRAVHALGPYNDSLVQRLRATRDEEDPSMTWLQWSPSGRSLLLAYSHGLQGQQHHGAILVFDIWQDMLVQSDYFAPYLGPFMAPTVWHPSSAGLVLSAGVELKHAAAFIQASLALGELPQYCYAHATVDSTLGMGFSPDGHRFLSRYIQAGVDSDNYWGALDVAGAPYPDKHCCMLKCESEGMKISFSPPHWHAHCHDCHWVPCGCKVVIGVYSGFELVEQGQTNCNASRIMEVSHSCVEETVTLHAPLKQAPIAFSPSARLVAETLGGPQILSVDSGAQVWAAPIPGTSYHPDRWGHVCCFSAFRMWSDICGRLLWQGGHRAP